MSVVGVSTCKLTITLHVVPNTETRPLLLIRLINNEKEP